MCVPVNTAMSSLYFINIDNHFLSTYNRKNIIISSMDKMKIHSLKSSILRYKHENDCILNKYMQMYKVDESFFLKMTTNKTRDKLTFDDIEIKQIDLTNQFDVIYLHDIYMISNSDLFVMYDFDIKICDSCDILSLNGLYVNNKDICGDMYETGTDFDVIGYLNSNLNI